MVPTGMRLGDRDNLVRIAHALFYVALVLALLWMFSCQWHARCSSGECRGNFSFRVPEPAKTGLDRGVRSGTPAPLIPPSSGLVQPLSAEINCVTVGDSDIGPIDPDADRRTLEPE
jgi:hypothetical protein